MEITFNINFKDSSLFYKVLKEEDFGFNNKDISVTVEKVEKNILFVKVVSKNLLDMKIGINAVLNSIIAVDKSLKVLENE